jgi:hypothetical protein
MGTFREKVKNIVDIVNGTRYCAPMAKTEPIGVRLEQVEREALEAAAAAGEWSTSFTARKAIVDWLTRGGWLKPLPKKQGKRAGK